MGETKGRPIISIHINTNALFLADVYLPTPRLDGDQTPASIVKIFVERAQDAMGLLDSGIEEEQLPTGVIIQAAENPRAFVNELVKETRDEVESGAIKISSYFLCICNNSETILPHMITM